MPRLIRQYVAFVEAVNYRLGRIVMYGIFVIGCPVVGGDLSSHLAFATLPAAGVF